jgi:Polyketide cyclase / dehydrase and lipid transport
MSNIAWEITCSVETDASPAFAWSYWTNIANWADPPAEFELDGPFASGARGTTRSPGREPLHWLIREVSPPNAATITIELDGAALSFQWRFDGLPGGRTRITQRVALQGENAGAYISQVESSFSSTLPDGMNKIATAMATSEASGKGPE